MAWPPTVCSFCGWTRTVIVTGPQVNICKLCAEFAIRQAEKIEQSLKKEKKRITQEVNMEIRKKK